MGVMLDLVSHSQACLHSALSVLEKGLEAHSIILLMGKTMHWLVCLSLNQLSCAALSLGCIDDALAKKCLVLIYFGGTFAHGGEQ